MREGELLIGILTEVLDEIEQEERERLRREVVNTGDGIEQVPGTLEWRATVPGFGYLEVDEDGVPQVVPAVQVTRDHHIAYLDLRPPSGDEPAVQLVEITKAVRDSGIVHGLSANHVQAAWRIYKTTGELPTPMRIATGTRPRRGTQPRLEWCIQIGKRVGSITTEQGQIDFRERQSVPNVSEGQRIAVWYPGAERQAGTGVDGAELMIGEAGLAKKLVVGPNINVREQEDGTSFLEAAVDGMLVLDENDVPRVSDTLEVPEDVSIKTGNIDAIGSVVVRGSIREGMRVTATRALTVHGVIESATVDVGGDLVAESGIVGDEGSLIHAAGNISMRYAQNAQIRAGGSVRVLDGDLGSTIECKGKLTATEGRGRLRGGTYVAGEEISVREAGSELGAPTVLSVGIATEEDVKLQRVRRDLQDVRAQLRLSRRTEPPINRKLTGPGSGLLTAPRLRPKHYRDLTRREASLRAKLSRLELSCLGSNDCQLTVLSQIHHGVEIVVKGKRHPISMPMTGRRFQLDPITREIDVQLL